MTDTRAFEMTIEIAVPVDAVWQAITTPDEITRWFASRADIVPGAGGKWMVSWDGHWPWDHDIEIWEPSRRMRLIDRKARPYDATGDAKVASVSPMPVAIDWYLEAKGGSTTLRLVHSGFGRGSAWDDEFEGVSLGWRMELNALKHYLERHKGETRRVAWTHRVVAAPLDTVWTRIVGRDGLVRDGEAITLRPGDRYSLTLSTGDRMEGTVVVAVPGRGFQVNVESWNDAMYRLWIDRAGPQCSVHSWLSTYGMPEDFAERFNERVRGAIDRVAETASLETI